MPKFSVKRNPTFTAAVSLPVVGGEAVVANFTFKHMNRIELAEFQNKRIEFAKAIAELASQNTTTASDIAKFAIDFEFPQLKGIIEAWDIEEELNDSNLMALVESGSELTAAIVNGFLDSYHKAREGN